MAKPRRFSIRPTALAAAVGLSFLLAACSGAAVQDEAGEVAPTTSAASESPSAETHSPSDGALGRSIVLTQWGMSFALPERFDVTDIRVIYDDQENYDLAVISGKSLPAKLNTEKCWGGTLELGSFVEVTRFDEPGDARTQIGDNYFAVQEGPATPTCYDGATYENYYAPDVVEAVRSSLKSL